MFSAKERRKFDVKYYTSRFRVFRIDIAIRDPVKFVVKFATWTCLNNLQRYCFIIIEINLEQDDAYEYQKDISLMYISH